VEAAISPHDDIIRGCMNRLKINANFDYFYWCCTSGSKLYATRQNHFGDFTHWNRLGDLKVSALNAEIIFLNLLFSS
jgi:hypothetical protein